MECFHLGVSLLYIWLTVDYGCGNYFWSDLELIATVFFTDLYHKCYHIKGMPWCIAAFYPWEIELQSAAWVQVTQLVGKSITGAPIKWKKSAYLKNAA